MNELLRRLALFFRRDSATRDLEDEMRLHRELRAESLRDMGVHDASAVASRRFGNATSTLEWSRDMWGFARLERTARDARYATRGLRRTPTFTFAAIATLGLGIGATTSIYSMARALWLAPLPYADPDRLVNVSDGYKGRFGSTISLGEVEDIAQSKSFELAYYGYGAAVVTLNDEPVRFTAFRVSGNLFGMLGAQPVLGRMIGASDARANAPPVVVLSNAFWRKQFAADPAVLGKTIRMYGLLRTVVGVMPPAFVFPEDQPSDTWVPFIPDFQNANRQQRLICGIARLKPDVTFAQARVEMLALSKRLADAFPASNADWSIELRATVDESVKAVRQPLTLLLAAVALLLLIGCANTAGLVLARHAARKHEFAVRASLGASRGRIAAHLFAEGMTLALLGGAVGVGLAVGGTRALIALLSTNAPRAQNIHVDGPVIAFAVAISVLTGVLCGIVPAWRVSIAAPADAMKAVARTVVVGGNRLRNSLIVIEVALSLMLLVGAGLMLQTFFRVLDRNRGFDPSHLLTLHVTAPAERYSDAAPRVELFKSLVAKVNNMPGVEATGLVTGFPGSGLGVLGWGNLGDPANSSIRVLTTSYAASPDYFAAMKVPLRAGRFFTDEDRAGNDNVVIVNAAFAAQLWPNEDAVGKTLSIPQSIAAGLADKAPYRVVGVVGNMSLGSRATSEIFLPMYQVTAYWTDVVIRTSGDPTRHAVSIRQLIRSMEPGFLIEGVMPMTQVIGDSLALQRAQSMVVALFGGLATILSAVGLYGLLSHMVGQRFREIGIRVALGATRGDVFRKIVVHGVALTALGIVIGGGATFALVRALKTKVFGMSVADPSVFASAALLLLIVSVVACYSPARRATRVDPVTALK